MERKGEEWEDLTMTAGVEEGEDTQGEGVGQRQEYIMHSQRAVMGLSRVHFHQVV